MTRVTIQIHRTIQRRTDSIGILKSFGTALVLAFGIHGLAVGIVDVTSLYAAETSMASRRSLMKADSHGDRSTENLVTVATVEPTLKPEKDPDRSKAGKKPRRLIRKPSAGVSPRESPRQPAQGGLVSSTPVSVDQGTPTTKDSASGMVQSSAGVSQVAPLGSPGRSLTTTSPGVTASSAIAGATAALPSSSMGAAGSGGPSSGGRSAQNVMRQLPNLQQFLNAQPVAGPPPEAIADPAPPLGPPQAGLPPAPLNWPAYHVLNRLAYGGTLNQLNTVSHLTAQEASAWAVRYMKEQLELDPNRPWPTNLHSTEPIPAPIALDDSALSQRLAADRADWRTEDGCRTSLRRPSASCKITI